jgi:hypothetical protein
MNTAKIFSSLQVLFSFKYSIKMVGFGLGFYYELKVILGRFASIFGINNTTMMELSPIALELATLMESMSKIN